MKKLEHLSEIYNLYDTYIIDLWGVMHNGIKLNERAIEVIENLSSKNKRIVFLSNAPRPSKNVIWFLKKLKMKKKFLKNVFTSGEAAIKSLKAKKFDCSPGNQKRDFLYVDDFVLAVYKSLKSNKNNGEIINIGSQKPTKIKNLILKIVSLVGKGKPNFSKIRIRTDEPNELFPDISKAKNILNWSPKTTLREGLKKTINYYKKNG